MNDRCELVRSDIDIRSLSETLGHPSCGAHLLFLGTVRNENNGQPVEAVTYEAFEPLAREVFRELVAEVIEHHPGISNVIIVHRLGTLSVGEVSTAIGVSSAHREECYEVSRYLIEQIKLRVPIWKEEHYVNGQKNWLEGAKLSEDCGSGSRRRPLVSNG